MQDVVAQLRRVAAAAIASLPLALPLQPALARGWTVFPWYIEFMSSIILLKDK